MYKIRFNLARGENYKKWQIKTTTSKYYLDPKKVNLIMEQCVLKNNKKIAKKIFEGENKSVCAWILCNKFSIKPIKPSFIINKANEIKYNPKKMPHWTDGKNNLDDKKFEKIITINQQLFTVN